MSENLKILDKTIDDEFGMSVDTDPSLLQEIIRVDQERRTGNFKNMLPVREISIPASILISCPKSRAQQHQAKYCLNCECFQGVVQTSYNDEAQMNWNDKYAISCNFPVDRKCISIAVGEP